MKKTKQPVRKSQEKHITQIMNYVIVGLYITLTRREDVSIGFLDFKFHDFEDSKLLQSLSRRNQ